jgi:hypothetical protein
MEEKLILAYKALRDVGATQPTPRTLAIIETAQSMAKELRQAMLRARGEAAFLAAEQKLDTDLA